MYIESIVQKKNHWIYPGRSIEVRVIIKLVEVVVVGVVIGVNAVNELELIKHYIRSKVV